MTYDATTLGPADLTPSLGRAWDALPARRGVHADFYDSWAWLGTWHGAADADVAAALRIPAVLDTDRPLALLPLLARSPRAWESAGRGGARMRYRPVLAAEQPDEDILGLLAQEVARAGVRDLRLNRLPGGDPATAALAGALRRAGFLVGWRERSSDCLALVQGGWAEHRRRFASYDRSVRTKVNRLRSLWPLTLQEFGAGTGVSPLEGYPIYLALYDRSWKPPRSAAWRARERALLCRAEELGWCRLYVLRAGGVPVAAHIWLRVGQVASWLETVYDQRMGAISPGSIVMWWAQERLFAESPPRVVDFLPGNNPLKDRLGPDRTPIVFLEAARRTLVSGISFPLRRQARYVAPRAAYRVRRRARRLLPARRRRVVRYVRTLEVGPGRCQPAARRFELDTAARRFLAVAGGHPSPEAVAARWAAEDSWWLAGEEPRALVRLGPAAASPRPVREIVMLDGGQEGVEQALAALAAALGTQVRADLPADDRSGRPGTPIPVYAALLPWPTQWRLST
jgi:Acetyltransferase (GNAT) domain